MADFRTSSPCLSIVKTAPNGRTGRFQRPEVGEACCPLTAASMKVTWNIHFSGLKPGRLHLLENMTGGSRFPFNATALEQAKLQNQWEQNGEFCRVRTDGSGSVWTKAHTDSSPQAQAVLHRDVHRLSTVLTADARRPMWSATFSTWPTGILERPTRVSASPVRSCRSLDPSSSASFNLSSPSSTATRCWLKSRCPSLPRSGCACQCTLWPKPSHQ